MIKRKTSGSCTAERDSVQTEPAKDEIGTRRPHASSLRGLKRPPLLVSRPEPRCLKRLKGLCRPQKEMSAADGAKPFGGLLPLGCLLGNGAGCSSSSSRLRIWNKRSTKSSYSFSNLCLIFGIPYYFIFCTYLRISDHQLDQTADTRPGFRGQNNVFRISMKLITKMFCTN